MVEQHSSAHRYASTGGMSRRDFLRLGGRAGLLVPLSTGAMSFVLTGCGGGAAGGGGGSQKRGTYMTAAGLGAGFIEVMIAQEQGFFADHGLDVDIRGGQGTATAIQAVIGGSVNWSRGGGPASIRAIVNEDAPITHIATVRQETHFEIVSLPEKPLSSPEQLEGKKIGVVSTGGSTEELLLLMLANADVPESTVQRPVTGLGAAAYQLAVDGEVDGWITGNYDRAAVGEEMGVELHAMKISDFVKAPADSYLITVEATESDDDTPERFLAGVRDAMKFAVDESNWDAVYDSLVAYNPDADKEKTLFELPFQIETWVSAGEENLLVPQEEVWTAGQEALEKAGFIDKTVPLDRLLYMDYINAVTGGE